MKYIEQQHKYGKTVRLLDENDHREINRILREVIHKFPDELKQVSSEIRIKRKKKAPKIFRRKRR